MRSVAVELTLRVELHAHRADDHSGRCFRSVAAIACILNASRPMQRAVTDRRDAGCQMQGTTTDAVHPHRRRRVARIDVAPERE
jgi:hypothetical protein